MKLKRFTALTMVTLLCQGLVAGCACSRSDTDNGGAGGNDGDTASVELLVWCPTEDQSSGWIKEMCEEFDDEHEEWDIEFRYQTCSEADADENVTQDPSMAGDIYFFASDQLTTLINADALSKLGGKTAEYVRESNNETLVNTVTYNGDIYGIPFTANTWFMYYDKSVFSQEDVKNLDTMLSKGKVAFPILDSWYLSAFYAAGGAMFSGEDGKDEEAGIVLGKNGVAVTEYLVNLVNNKNFVNDASGSGLAGLRDGSVNAMFSGTWDYEAVKNALGDNLGVRQLPTININGEQMQMKAFAGSKCIGVNPYTEYPEIAISLAKYLAGEESQLEHYEMRSIIPCNVKLLENEKVKNDILTQAQNNTILYTSMVQPDNASFEENYWSNAEAFSNELLDGRINLSNASEATKNIEDAWNGR